VFETMHELARLRRLTETIWSGIDVLVVPAVHEPARIADAMREPFGFSRAAGQLSNFVNLLDLAGCAVPTGAWSCGVPFGVTLCAPACSEEVLLDVGARLAAQSKAAVPVLERPRWIRLAVVGAHLEGMPLHPQLTALGARLVAKTRTAPRYRLHALANTSPPKPGLELVGDGGAAIEVEIYSLAPDAFGRFVAAVPRPLAIGRLELDDGSQVSGFVCEPSGLEGATDITSYGGWRAWCARD
jgi:allophanate hydrolase